MAVLAPTAPWPRWRKRPRWARRAPRLANAGHGRGLASCGLCLHLRTTHDVRGTTHARIRLARVSGLSCAGATRRLLLSPGSLFLGNPGQAYECSHRHGEGDRPAPSFQFEPAAFERLAHDAGARFAPRSIATACRRYVRSHRSAARAQAAMQSADEFEEIAYALAGAAVRTASEGRSCPGRQPSSRPHRKVLQHIAARVAQQHTIVELARMAWLQPCHFLRTFKQVTGVTPHQWLLRARLRGRHSGWPRAESAMTGIALEAGSKTYPTSSAVSTPSSVSRPAGIVLPPSQPLRIDAYIAARLAVIS